MNKAILISAALGALSLAGHAGATVKNFSISAADTSALGGAGPYGTIQVTDFGTNKLEIAVSLSGYVFQDSGASPFDSLTFNVAGDPILSASFVTPAGGIITADESFGLAAFSAGAYGKGWAKGFNNAIQLRDQGSPFSYPTQMTVDIFANPSATILTVNSIVARTLTPTGGSAQQIYFGLDLAKAPGGVGFTGPAGATLVSGGVPEPASWALMILGFGGVGAVLRTRRQTRGAITA